MNPVKFSKEVKGYKHGVSQRKYFLKWIKKNLGLRAYEMAIKSEKNFKYKERMFERIIKQSKYRNKYSSFSWR